MPNVHGGRITEFGVRALEKIVVVLGWLVMETGDASVCPEEGDGAKRLIENVVKNTLFSLLAFGLRKWN